MDRLSRFLSAGSGNLVVWWERGHNSYLIKFDFVAYISVGSKQSNLNGMNMQQLVLFLGEQCNIFLFQRQCEGNLPTHV
jgi:hypothetical protein